MKPATAKVSTGSALRVVMISSYYPPLIGGISVQVQGTAQALTQLGVETHIITRSADPAAHGVVHAEEAGVIVHRVGAPEARWKASPLFVWQCTRLLGRLQPAIVHAHELLLPATAALAAKRLTGCPVVVTVHSSGNDLGECARLRRARFGHRRAAYVRAAVDRFVAISQAVAADMAAIGIPAHKRAIIPNGIDMEHFAPAGAGAKAALRRRLGLPDGVLVVYTGRLSSEKRVLPLVQAWAHVRQAHPDATLVIVGDGPEEQDLRRLHAPGVLPAGAQADPAPYLQAADLFVMPSAAEGFSLSTLEALACGLPVVATTVGAIPELVNDPETGRLVAPDDFQALTAALCELLAQRTAWPHMGARGRQSVMQTYSLPSITQRLLELYRQL